MSSLTANLLLALLPALGAASEPAAPEAQLDSVLADMEAAVLAGDADAYLLHVSPADPIFFKEQANWAADLKRHVPIAFDLEIVEPPPPEDAPHPAPGGATDDQGAQPAPNAGPASIRAPLYTESRAVVELRTTWTLGEDATGGEPVERTISFPVIFEKSAADGQDSRTGGWLYAGEEWVVIEQGDNRVMCPAGYEAAAQQVAEELPGVRAHVDQLFGRPIDHVQEVKLYPSVLHLQHSIYLSYLDGLGGWNEPGESIKILARPGPAGRARREHGLAPLLAHEYGHVATFELGDHANDMPWWLLEGIAEFSAADYADFRGDSDRFVIVNYRANTLADWPALADFHDIDPALMAHVYRQGHHMVEFVAERYTREKMIDWLDRMADGATLDEASRAALGESFESIDAAWRAHVAELAADNDP